MAKGDEEMVNFQGRKVPKLWKEAYMFGYSHGYKKPCPEHLKQHISAYNDGKTIASQHACWEGTF